MVDSDQCALIIVQSKIVTATDNLRRFFSSTCNECLGADTERVHRRRVVVALSTL